MRLLHGLTGFGMLGLATVASSDKNSFWTFVLVYCQLPWFAITFKSKFFDNDFLKLSLLFLALILFPMTTGLTQLGIEATPKFVIDLLLVPVIVCAFCQIIMSLPPAMVGRLEGSNAFRKIRHALKLRRNDDLTIGVDKAPETLHLESSETF